jgi:hypothetical protein
MPGPNFTGLDKGYIADSAVTQFHAVKFGTADEHCTIVTAITDTVLGFSQEAVPVGSSDIGKRAINIREAGITYAKAAGTIARGAYVKVTATGAVIAAVAGDPFCGRAEMSAVSGDLFTVYIMHGVMDV